mmetsp:Transcript_84481/g.262316  ORF Transcript_84481/g.262316 Transcript_84481/m.262316 type:complete len:605 (-) Transcript_84481:116-1930(-)|eukprot:CAMPEP_0204567792 /NCGR_PEP_ID=MMETSP0661-20131031/36797_1 /ASSEMBLY_ACC=CAM_ASM_000606 /TAXON_ID=109239 /ORGANISM="Alexandrium margalefi, Strain AMGDE01CS-322" /LENGTH=604 /DNA_ID=CAMNT_0051575739 /DNA_START=54 /DNA_END=1868 /DNA_ORIENTATION=+
MSFKRTGLVAISGQGEGTRESFLRRLQSYNKEKILKVLKDLESSGPDFVQALNVGDAVASKLGHQDPEVQTAAVTVIGLLGSKGSKYEQYLAPCLGNPSAEMRAASVEAIGRLGPYFKDSEIVAGSAVDSEALVRVKVCQALADMEATSKHETLSTLLSDPVPEVQSAALVALGSLVGISLEMQSQYGSKIGDTLEKMLDKARTKEAALDAVAAMGEKAPPSCVGSVVAALGDADSSTRAAAVRAIGAMGEVAATSKDAMPKLKDLLKKEDAGVKAAAATALAAMGEKASAAADDLAALLTDDSEDQSGLALVVGGGSRRPPPQLRRPKAAAVSALGHMGVEGKASKISEALNDGNWEVRLCAAEALAVLKSKAKGEVSALMGCLEDDAFPVRAMACFALGQIGDTEALARLVEAFEDSAFTVRMYAVQAVGEMGSSAEEHGHEVFKLTNDPVGDVRAAAVKVLSALGETAQNYAGVVATMVTDEDAGVRAAVCESLANMGEAGAECQPEIEDLFSDTVPGVRMAAIAAVEAMGNRTSPFIKDFGRGQGVPHDMVPYWRSSEEKPSGVLMPGEVCFEGLGLHFGDIISKKQELMQAGKWIEGVL